MAWPTDWADGEDITATRLKQWTDAQKTWPGNVDGGGYNLTNLSELHGNGSTNILKFFTNSSERMRIAANGNVSIGGTPLDKFEVMGAVVARGAAAANMASAVALDFSGGNARIISRGPDAATCGGFQVLLIRSDGTGLLTPFQVDSSGRVIGSWPTSSAGLPSGAVWRDAAAGNVLKAIP